MLNGVKHTTSKDQFLGVRISADTMEWLKAKASADCRTVSSFVLKLIADQRRFDHDDELAEEISRELAMA